MTSKLEQSHSSLTNTTQGGGGGGGGEGVTQSAALFMLLGSTRFFRIIDTAASRERRADIR